MSQFKFQISFVKPAQVKHLPRDKNFVSICAPYDVTAADLGEMILDGYQQLTSMLKPEDVVFVIKVESDD